MSIDPKLLLRRSLASLLPPVLAAAMAGTPAMAQSKVADFYKGKEIKVLVSSAAGGGYDSYSRLLAAHFGRFIPGEPNVVVENMPGTGGLKAANYLYNEAPRDGLMFGNVQRQVPFSQIMKDKRAKFIAAKFNWIGSMNNEVTVCVAWHQSPVKSFDDLRKYPLVIGGSGPNDTELVPAFLNNTLGTNFDIVTGYGSATSITLAIESGEVEGTCTSFSSLQSRNADWFKNKKIKIIVQASTRKHPDLPDVPLALDLAKDPELRELMALNDARLEIGRPFLAPPEVPADRVAALRTAFDRTMVDAKFKADVKLQKRDVTPVSGKDVQALIERVSKASDTMIARLNDALIYKAKKAGAKIEMKEVEGPVTAIENEGRRVAIKGEEDAEYKAKVSPTRTVVTIAGKPTSPADLAVGMTCTIRSLGSGLEAVNVSCK